MSHRGVGEPGSERCREQQIGDLQGATKERKALFEEEIAWQRGNEEEKEKCPEFGPVGDSSQRHRADDSRQCDAGRSLGDERSTETR